MDDPSTLSPGHQLGTPSIAPEPSFLDHLLHPFESIYKQSKTEGGKAAQETKEVLAGKDPTTLAGKALKAVPWREIGVYGGLAILFLIGVIGLLSASGTVSVEKPSLTLVGPKKRIKIGK